MIREIKYKQLEPYGCGLFAISNVFDINFLTIDRLERCKSGCNIGLLSKWMQEDGYNMYIDTLYYNHLGRKLPTSQFKYYPSGGVAYLPILLNVRFSKDGVNHLIGGRIDTNGKLFLFDSLQKEMIETTLSKVNKLYDTVFGLFIFIDLDNGNYIFLNE
jgi:hypothetical protein